MESIRFSSVELGMMREVILNIEISSTVTERKPYLSKLTSFVNSMISFRRPTIKRPSITIKQIQRTHFLDTQDTVYTIFYEEKQHAQNNPKVPL